MRRCTFETANAWLRYEPETGLFYWRESPRANVAAGDAAGHFEDDEQGFKVLRIRLGGVLYSASHLVVLLTTGVWPDGVVLQINNDRRDLRLGNLRIQSRSEIRLKTSIPNKTNKTGFLGVSVDAGRYVARFRNKHIGQFNTPEAASAAYWAYRTTLGESLK